jgi:hypothetical protein
MKRVWVLGNGPSLKNTPLDKLIGEECVAINRIHLIYPLVAWRPTCYVKTDHNPHLVEVWADETMLQVNMGIPCYLWEMFKTGYPESSPIYRFMPYGIGDHPNITWIPRCKHHEWAYYSRGNKGEDNRRALAWHLPEICTAYSGISPAIQVAYHYLGADEIYLLGCDLGYGKPQGQDHFHSGYSWDTRKLNDFDTNQVLEAHRIAKASCPVPIYNATLGGELEVYERVDFFQTIEERNETSLDSRKRA